MVELLVAIFIGGLVSAAILMGWFSLSRSYSMSTKSSEARELARDAVSRMAREIRDAEPISPNSAITAASPTIIEFTTTFNDASNTTSTSLPHETAYEYVWDAATGEGALHRVQDTDGNTGNGYERDNIVVRHLLNDGSSPVFQYVFLDQYGDQTVGDTPYSLATVMLVRVRLLVDMNPGKAPNPMDLTTEVQLRNQRQY